MITCRELIDFLADYVEGTLPADQRHVFDEHLGICPECQAYLATYRTTVHLEKASAELDETACGVLPEGLVRAILAARPRSRE